MSSLIEAAMLRWMNKVGVVAAKGRMNHDKSDQNIKARNESFSKKEMPDGSDRIIK